MAATFEQDRHFADGCYHVNAFFCLSRRTGSTESPCERFIGQTKYLFNAVQGTTTTALVHRLRARTYGLRGCGADDQFVGNLAQSVFTVERQSQASAIDHRAEMELARVEQEAPWLLQVPATGAGARPVKAKALMAQVAATQAACEPWQLEEEDLELLQQETRPGRCATLPLFASTGRQWAAERQGHGMQPAHPLGPHASGRERERNMAAGRARKEANLTHQVAQEAAWAAMRAASASSSSTSSSSSSE